MKRLAPQVGLEPTTLRLTAECSTIELLRSNFGGLLYYIRASFDCQFSRWPPTLYCSYRSHTTGFAFVIRDAGM